MAIQGPFQFYMNLKISFPISEKKNKKGCLNFFFVFLFVLFFVFFCPAARGGSQARGQIRAVSSGLCHNHSNARSEPHL